MDRSSRIMERALTEDVDIFTDYAGAAEETEAYVIMRIYVFSKLWYHRRSRYGMKQINT